MYCPNCGKKIPDDSKFCLHCGKPINKPKSTQFVIDWEYKDFVMTFPPKKIRSVSASNYTEPAARLTYWQNYQSLIMPELQKWLDDGWQPLTEISPSCIQLDTYRLTQSGWSIIIGGFFVFPIILIVSSGLRGSEIFLVLFVVLLHGEFSL